MLEGGENPAVPAGTVACSSPPQGIDDTDNSPLLTLGTPTVTSELQHMPPSTHVSGCQLASACIPPFPSPLLWSECVPQTPYVKTLTAKVKLSEGGAFGKLLSQEGGALTSGISALIKESPECSLDPSAPCRHNEKSAPQKKPSPDQAGTLIAAFLPPEV